VYVKLFERLLKSSLMDTDIATRWAWVSLLLQADQAGMVYGTVTALARAANMPPEQMAAAMDVFQAPDLNSTSDEDDGRRVLNVAPNTWLLVNYEKYRNMRDPDVIRAQTRARTQIWRSKRENGDAGDAVVTLRDAKQKQKQKQKQIAPLPSANAEGSATAGDAAVPAAPKAAPKGRPNPIILDRETWRIEGVTPEHVDRWSRANPLVDIQADIAAAEAWCGANPDRAPRVRIEAFLVKWFARSQERSRKGVKSTTRRNPDDPTKDRYGRTYGSVLMAREWGLMPEGNQDGE
jgi:hypothetical protein